MHHSEIVADGYERAWRGIEEEIRAEVEERYAAEWNAAGLLKRYFLLRKIGREVAAKLANTSYEAPPDALY